MRILALLQNGTCCVGDLVNVLDIEQPGASRHLAYLRKAGLVSVRKAAQWSMYTLAAPTCSFHEKLLECLACCFDEVPEIQADREKAKNILKSGGCCPEAKNLKAREDNAGTCCSKS